MKFKRIISYLTIFMLCFMLSACGGGISKNTGNKNDNKKTTQNTSNNTAKNNYENSNSEKESVKSDENTSTIIYKITSNTDKNIINTIKEEITSRLKLTVYSDYKISTIDKDKIEVVIPKQDDIMNFAEKLISSSVTLTFTDCDNHVWLTDKDISKASAEYDERNKSYYVLLKFTEQGRKKLKAATSAISKKQQNFLSIMLDGLEYSRPYVSEEIDSGEVIISGDFTKDNAKIFAHTIQWNIVANKALIKIAEVK